MILHAIVFTFFVQAHAGVNFKTGVSIRNEDPVARKFNYDHRVLPTAICEATPGNPLKMKRGVPSFFDRKPVKGLKILKSSPDPLKQNYSLKTEISAQTTIHCLCSSSCVLALDDGNIVTVPDGGTAIIKDNKLSVE